MKTYNTRITTLKFINLLLLIPVLLLTIINCESEEDGKIENLTKEIDALKVANNNLQAQINSLTGNNSVNISDLQGILTMLQNELNSLSGNNSTLQGMVTMLQNELNSLSGNNSTLQGMVTMLQNELNTLSGGTSSAQINQLQELLYLVQYNGVYDITNVSGSNSTYGIWSDGVTMWIVLGDIVNNRNRGVIAYSMITESGAKRRVSSEDFVLSGTSPTGVWSDGTTMWVADEEIDKIFAYNLRTKARVPTQDFNTLSGAGNNNPFGLWSDGETMWVTELIDVDANKTKIYAYDLGTKARVPTQDFNTLSGAGNTSPFGLWSNGETMWVSNNANGKIYAYNLGTKVRESSQEFDVTFNPIGIWSDRRTIWVSNGNNTRNIFAYDFETKARRQ